MIGERVSRVLAATACVFLLTCCGVTATCFTPLPDWKESVVPSSALQCEIWDEDNLALKCLFASGVWTTRYGTGRGIDHTIYWADKCEMPLLALQGISGPELSGVETALTSTVTLHADGVGQENFVFVNELGTLSFVPEQESVRAHWAGIAPSEDGPNRIVLSTRMLEGVYEIRYVEDRKNCPPPILEELFAQ